MNNVENGSDMNNLESPLEKRSCSTQSTTMKSDSLITDKVNWSKVIVGDDDTKGNYIDTLRRHCKRQFEIMRSHPQILLVSVFIFAVIAGAGITLYKVFSESNERVTQGEALALAADTGNWFAKELDLAILPLFSIAQFATEIDTFSDLPGKIGQAFEPGSLPFLTNDDGSFNPHRNITGVCDDPELVTRFSHIASAIKKNAKMDGILHNIQLAPHGVICLLYPLNNTEDFEDGKFLDSTKALGIDLLNDSVNKYIARTSLVKEDVGIAGPRPLTQCPTCGLYFIVRLPVVSEKHEISIDGIPYPRWGFATALINWDKLIARIRVHEIFEERGFVFKLTRTDRTFNVTTNSYDVNVVVLAQSDDFGTKAKQVTTALQTTNNEWMLTVQYDDSQRWAGLVTALSLVIAFCIAFLVYVVLVQKQLHAAMLGTTMAQEAKVEIERKMTAYFAHELRNPLSAIDSALEAMPKDGIPEEARELIASMQLCSTFMSSIMNNLLDVRKIEEGKLVLRSDPLSLKQLVGDIRKMALPSVAPAVELRVLCDTGDRDWVLGDGPRIQQVMANLVSNAIKYTMRGSVTLVAAWDGDLVRLECRDTGPGIPKEEQAHMFERFTQRGGAPGSGLGLAITKQIVTLMKGSIHFDSDPTLKPGTTCTVLLALQRCEETKEPESQPEDLHLLDEPLSILVVDDARMNRAMLKRRFQKGIAPNCEVTEAVNGEQALVICNREVFDVIIVDQYMEEAGGVMVGTDVIIAMRRSRVASIIIGCSGNDLDDEFHAAGADLIWKKPMPSNAEIIRQLRHELGRRSGFPLSESTTRLSV